MFIAEFKDRFEEEVIAEMRGVVGKDGKSPLWMALGSHFFQIDFPKAETLTSQSKKFIADLMPKHPIYIPLLPESAQDVIGKVHENTAPALSVLEKEGFEFRKLVDIFDGGPTMHCAVKNIRAVNESKSGTVQSIEPKIKNGSQQIVSNANIDFRVCLGDTAWDKDKVAIDEVTALRLNLKVGDAVRCVNLKPKSQSKNSKSKNTKSK
jgi:arginine N-succinyltransferase